MSAAEKQEFESESPTSSKEGALEPKGASASGNGSTRAEEKLAEQASEKSSEKKKKPVNYAIRTTNLTKRFGSKTAVNSVNLKIRAGHIFGLIGPNGAGKTTTFSMLAGFLKPTEGSIEILGFEPTNVQALRSRFGVLPQDALLPSTETVGEFLVHMARLQNIPAEKAEEEARKVLVEVSGNDWWKQRCGGLSHGMQKRIAIAQALLGEPEVVFLDEPTAGVDPRVAYELREVIRARKGRCTMVISSHNLQELEEICDAAAILDHGKLVTSGSMAELTATNGEFRVRVKLPPGASIPYSDLRAIPQIKSVETDGESPVRGGGSVELIFSFERGQGDAEVLINQVLWCFINARIGISGVSKGKSLEKRVMELTE
jgi:ABC-2 type transport system ATP-binding protein